jgi:hypothetical protein
VEGAGVARAPTPLSTSQSRALLTRPRYERLASEQDAVCWASRPRCRARSHVRCQRPAKAKSRRSTRIVDCRTRGGIPQTLPGSTPGVWSSAPTQRTPRRNRRAYVRWKRQPHRQRVSLEPVERHDLGRLPCGRRIIDVTDVADIERGLDNVGLNIAIEPHAQERPECEVEPGLLPYFPDSRFGGVFARLAKPPGISQYPAHGSRARRTNSSRPWCVTRPSAHGFGLFQYDAAHAWHLHGASRSRRSPHRGQNL